VLVAVNVKQMQFVLPTATPYCADVAAVSGQGKRMPLFQLKEHTCAVTSLAVSPRTGLLISCGLDGLLLWWHYVSQQLRHRVHHNEAFHCLRPRWDCAEILVGTHSGRVLRFKDKPESSDVLA
jgi:hypothetical protein